MRQAQQPRDTLLVPQSLFKLENAPTEPLEEFSGFDAKILVGVRRHAYAPALESINVESSRDRPANCVEVCNV